MNLQPLAARLQSMGIMGKPFADLSREEAEALVLACWETIEPTDSRRMPYFKTRPGGARELFVPFDSPAMSRHWLHDDGWMTLFRVLEALGATAEEKARYLGPDWMERMHKRTLYTSTPGCPVCGSCKEDS